MPLTIDQAKSFMVSAHHGQVDKAGRPYEEHPTRVHERLMAIHPTASLDAQHAALMHDVIEDTPVTEADLWAMGFSERTISLVRRLSGPVGITYLEWIGDIASSGDVELIAIKLADNEDNSDPGRIAALPEPERNILSRYERSKTILRTALMAGSPTYARSILGFTLTIGASDIGSLARRSCESEEWRKSLDTSPTKQREGE